MRGPALGLVLLVVLTMSPAIQGHPLPGEPDILASWQWHLARIHADSAPIPHEPPLLAILDSGVDATHADLAPNLWTGNPQHGASFARPFGVFTLLPVGPNTTTLDEEGHGTAVTGLAAAVAGNGLGGRGVVQAPVLVVKTSALGAPLDQRAIAQGIHYAVDNGARVVSISATATVPLDELRVAMRYAERHDVVVVAAAGNSGNDRVHYPAGFPTVVSVAATQRDDTPAPFSSHGKVDLAAPGVELWTATLGNTYGQVEGTSMATPQVAAAAVHVRAAAPLLDAAQVRHVLNQTAQDVGAVGPDDHTGHGVVDVAAAVALAAQMAGGAS